jgi:hypothetical protein
MWDLMDDGGPATVNREILDDAIDEAVLRDQAATASKDESRFRRRLEQLDRYLEDQVLVLKRKLALWERRLAEMESKKQSATAPSAHAETDRYVRVLNKDISNLKDRIERLRQGDEPDYQEWRARLFERRFQRPAVERIVEFTFTIGGGGTC